jgi:hypothetical protein
MLLLHKQRVKVRVEALEGDLAFPAAAVVNIVLGPADLFGLAPLNGKLGVVPVGSSLEHHRTDLYGVDRLTVSGSFQRAKFDSSFLGYPFVLSENTATFRFSVQNLGELDKFVMYANALFAGLFSVAYPIAVDIEAIEGTLADKRFTVCGELSVSNPILCVRSIDEIKPFFDETTPQSFLPSIPLIAAVRYLQQSERLRSESPRLTTFMAERLLNLAKSLEALFSGEVDDMRHELTSLNVAPEYVSVFSSIRYLRNQVDVGHVSFSDLPSGVVQEVFEFVELGAACARALLGRLLNDGEAQQRLYNLRAGAKKPKIPDAIAYLRHYSGLHSPRNNNLSDVNRDHS